MNNKELLIAEMTIGDGHLNQKNLEILHCEKQKEYLNWKKQLLINEGIECCPTALINNNGFNAYRFRTKSYPWIKDLRELIYCPSKIYSLEILKEFTPLGLAIWYFDDGCLSQKKRNGVIHANDLILNTGLQKEENQIYINYFKDYWDINFTQVKNHNCYRLRCGTREARKFITIIKDYLPPGMDYKIAIKQ